MTRYVCHPSSVTVVVREHRSNCSCQQTRPGVIDLRCVAEYVVEVADEPPTVEATRSEARTAAVEAARAGDYAGATAWAMVHGLLPEVAEAPLDDTAVIPRVEPGQGGDPMRMCYCASAWIDAGRAHPAGVRGCESRP